MAIEYTVESLDKVGEDIRDAYVQAEDGKFNLDPDKYAEIKVASGLKIKNKELHGKLKEKDTELAKFGKFKSLTDLLADADDEELSQFQERWAKRHEADPKGKATTDDSIKLKEQLEKTHQKQLKAKDEAIAKYEAELNKVKGQLRDINLWTPLREVFLKAGGDPTDWEVARLELANQKRFDFDENGKIVVMEDGEPSVVTPEKFFQNVYSEARPKFYKASAAAGSGAPNNTSGGQGRSIAISRAQAKDTATYRAAKARADKAGVELQIID